MRKALFFLLCFVFIFSVISADEGWITEFETAVKKAKEEGKYILVDFSGSDWCGWCKKLDKEVFKKNVFLNFVKKHFVLCLLDFPKGNPALYKKNQKWAKKFKIRGFPSVFLMDANGVPFCKTGYRRGGAERYVQFLAKALKTKKSFDHFEKSSLSPVAKAQKAAELLDNLEQEFAPMQKNLAEVIYKNDFSNSTGQVYKAAHILAMSDPANLYKYKAFLKKSYDKDPDGYYEYFSIMEKIKKTSGKFPQYYMLVIFKDKKDYKTHLEMEAKRFKKEIAPLLKQAKNKGVKKELYFFKALCHRALNETVELQKAYKEIEKLDPFDPNLKRIKRLIGIK